MITTIRNWDPWTVRGTLKRTACIQCPTCHKAIILADYAISDDGTVSRRVICPHCNRNVGDIQLAGWDGDHPHGPFDIDLME